MRGSRSDSSNILIINKLMKNNDARIVQYVANAVSEYATSTRDLRRTRRGIAALPRKQLSEWEPEPAKGESDRRGAEREF